MTGHRSKNTFCVVLGKDLSLWVFCKMFDISRHNFRNFLKPLNALNLSVSEKGI